MKSSCCTLDYLNKYLKWPVEIFNIPLPILELSANLHSPYNIYELH